MTELEFEKNFYPGLYENLERFKLDLNDPSQEKLVLLCKIMYKQGYDSGTINIPILREAFDAGEDNANQTTSAEFEKPSDQAFAEFYKDWTERKTK